MSEKPKDRAKCKACKKGGDEVEFLLGLSQRVFICEKCVEVCRDLIGARRVAVSSGASS